MAAELVALHMPAYGEIRGGRLHGWRFHFQGFEVEQVHSYDETGEILGGEPGAWLSTSYELRVVAKCTPPAWPFPRVIHLEGGHHYHQLRAVKGERPKRIPADPLIEQAYRAVGVSCSWLDKLKQRAERKASIAAAEKQLTGTALDDMDDDIPW